MYLKHKDAAALNIVCAMIKKQLAWLYELKPILYLPLSAYKPTLTYAFTIFIKLLNGLLCSLMIYKIYQLFLFIDLSYKTKLLQLT